MSQPLLTAAMIVRDEEQHLPACLASLAGVADEVVVVDTGSRDRSPEIARHAGSRVIERPWNGSFTDARNVALDNARGRWILYIDADERLAPVEREVIEDLLGTSDQLGYRLLFHPLPHYSPYREHRLWRNDECIRFAGLIHEKIGPSILAAGGPEAFASCDLRMFGVYGHALLGLAHVRAGRFAESAQAYQQAVLAEPDNPEHALKRNLARARC